MDDIGTRMKRYEIAARTSLPPRLPIVIRVDGKSFHTWTRGCERPFDSRLGNAMLIVAGALCGEIQGSQFSYSQSDEISIFVHGYKTFGSQGWFDNQIQKMVSVAASIAAAQMTMESVRIFGEHRAAHFDARAFVLPEAEVANYFLWRQQDASRNSIQMLARSLYSHKELDGKNRSTLHELCFAKGHNWADLPTRWRRGFCLYRHEGGWTIDQDIPLFNEERQYIEKHLATESE